MSQVLMGLEFCFAYHDDISIDSTSRKEHLEHLETIFSHLQAANLKIKLSKCQFHKQHLHYLGYLILEQGVQPLPDKIQTITNLAAPNNIYELHFLGVTGHCRTFILSLTDRTKPINKLLWKDTKFHWSNNAKQLSII